MSWRDELRRVVFHDGRRLVGASFRGVPFFVESHERSGGRRTVTHEFPFRDDPYRDDLGRRARTFRIEGYVLGDEYLDRRDALIEALEDEDTPGELIHPYFKKSFSAICPNFTERETSAEGRFAVFSIEFEETPAQAFVPSSSPDLRSLVSLSADAALAAANGEFLDSFDVIGMPGHALESLSLQLSSMSSAVDDAFGPITKTAQEAARLDSQLRQITAQAGSLVRQPGDILGSLQDALGALADTALAFPGAVMAALLSAFESDLGPRPVATTPTREREQANHDALGGFLRRFMVIEAARLAPRAEFETQEDATAAATEISEKLEEESATATDDTYPALVQLRTDVLRAVPGEELRARLIEVTRPVPIPSILLSYQLYGSTTQELDIVARNRIRHPGVVSGTLKVLSDAS